MVGKRLKELLIKNNVTQAELCRRLGISPGSMSNFINNRRTPSFAVIAAIADYFSVGIDSFITDKAVLNIGKRPNFSELPERVLAMNKEGLWVRLDTDSYSPSVRKDSLIYIDNTSIPVSRDYVVFYRKNVPSLFKLLQKKEGVVLIPLKKEGMPIDINGTLKGVYKVLYIAHEP